MRRKTNEFLRRIQSVRPEVKKNFRRTGANAPGKFRVKVSLLEKRSFFVSADTSAGVE